MASPNRFPVAQSLASTRQPRVLHASLRRVQQRLGNKFRNVKIIFGQGLSDAGHVRKLMEVFTKVMVLPRGDLRSAFQGVSFASAGDENRRMQHVLNDLVRTSEAGCVDLADLFPDSDPPAPSIEPTPTESSERRPGSVTAPLCDVTSKGDFVESRDNVVEDLRSVRVLLIASAGCGKTTLMTKYYPMQWARGELWAEKFDLVVAREFRYKETCCISGVGELLGGWSSLNVESSEDRQCIADFVVDNPQRVCLILDGLDETKLSKCSEYLQKVIQGEELCGIHLVLTSRATEDVFKLSELYPFDRRLELVGFMPSDVPEYVKCVLGEVDSEELLAECQANPYITSMMCTPFFAAAICDLYQWRKQVPSCLSDIFELMILRIAERRTKVSYTQWKDLEPAMKMQILELGKFAFNALIDQCLVFDGSDLGKFSLSEDALGLGLLVACEREAEMIKRQWRFAHLSVQEGLSAVFVAHGNRMSPRKIVHLVETLGPLSGHLETFWRLLSAQLNPECMDCLVNALLLCDHKPAADISEDKLLCEHAIVPDAVLDVLAGRFSQDRMDRLAEKLLSGLKVVGSGARSVENRMQRSRQTSNADFLKALLQIWRDLDPAASFEQFNEAVHKIDVSAAESCREEYVATAAGQDVLLPMRSFLEPFGPGLARTKLVFRCYSEYVQHDSHAVTATVVDGDGDDVQGSQRALVLPSISSHLGLDGIYVGSRSTAGAMDLYALKLILEHHASFVAKVMFVPFSGIREVALEMDYSLACTNISELEVDCFSGIAPELDSSLCALVEKSTNLAIVKWRTRDHVSMKMLARLLAHCRKLKVLDLQGYISASCSPVLSAALESMNDLETFSQTATYLDDEDCRCRQPLFPDLIAALAHCRQLKVLRLDGDITELCLPVLSAIPESMDVLETFQFFSSTRSANSLALESLQPCLSKMSSLQELHLSSFSSGDFLAISKIAPNMPCLQHLELVLRSDDTCEDYYMIWRTLVGHDQDEDDYDQVEDDYDRYEDTAETVDNHLEHDDYHAFIAAMPRCVNLKRLSIRGEFSSCEQRRQLDRSSFPGRLEVSLPDPDSQSYCTSCDSDADECYMNS